MRLTRAANATAGFFRKPYKTGAEKEKLAKERQKRLDDAALKRAKAAPKSKKKVHKKGSQRVVKGGRARAPTGGRKRATWSDTPGWMRLQKAAAQAGYCVAKLDVCDNKNLERPANRPRTFAVLSLQRPLRDINVAFDEACRRAAARAEWKWLGGVFQKKTDLVRCVAYVCYMIRM